MPVQTGVGAAGGREVQMWSVVARGGGGVTATPRGCMVQCGGWVLQCGGWVYGATRYHIDNTWYLHVESVVVVSGAGLALHNHQCGTV